MTNTFSTSDLPISGHQAVKVNESILLFGKNPKNSQDEHSLYRFCMNSGNVEAVYSAQTPRFLTFAIFSKDQTIYLWGKTLSAKVTDFLKQKNQLFAYDGVRFSKVDQEGSIPHRDGGFSYCFFSERFLLIFGGHQQNTYLNSWHLFDLERLYWHQLSPNIDIPYSDRSSITWVNGRGYISIYTRNYQNSEPHHNNHFYEFKFQHQKDNPFGHRQLFRDKIILEEISFLKIQKSIMSSDVGYCYDIIICNEKQICFLATNRMDHGQKIEFETFSGQKAVQNFIFRFNLETFQWECNLYKKKAYIEITLNRQEYKSVQVKNKVYIFGGYKLNSSRLKEYNSLIQLIDLTQVNSSTCLTSSRFLQSVKTYNKRDISYLQSTCRSILEEFQSSTCYECQFPYTYDQLKMKQPAIDIQYEKYTPRQKIQNKFLNKFSKSIRNEFAAFGMIVDFFKYSKIRKLKISLEEASQHIHTEKMMSSTQMQIKKFRGSGSYLKFQGSFNSSSSIGIQSRSYTSSTSTSTSTNVQSSQLQKKDISESEICTVNKIAAFKLGSDVLCVWVNKNKQIEVRYFSSSPLHIPQTVWKHSSTVSYIITYENRQFVYSSQVNRQIIFENLKSYFDRPELYQNRNILKNVSSSIDLQKTKHNSQSSSGSKKKYFMYIFGVENLESNFSISLTKPSYADILIKSLSTSNKNQKCKVNSLREYLKRLYRKSEDFEIFLNDLRLQKVDILQEFINMEHSLNNIKKLKVQCISLLSPSKSSLLNKTKNQLQQTHFSSAQDDPTIFKMTLDFVKQAHLFQKKTDNNSPESLAQTAQTASNQLQKMQNLSDSDKRQANYWLMTTSILLYCNGRLIQAVNTKRRQLFGLIELSEKISLTLDHSILASQFQESQLVNWLNDLEKSFYEKLDQQ